MIQASSTIYARNGYIFSLRNFGQMSKLERNFSVVLKFISVIFHIASMMLILECKILQNFDVILIELANLFLVIYQKS